MRIDSLSSGQRQATEEILAQQCRMQQCSSRESISGGWLVRLFGVLAPPWSFLTNATRYLTAYGT